MKRLCLALLTLFGIALIIACKKENSFEIGFVGNLDAQWEFKEGTRFKGKVDTAYIEDPGGIRTLFLEGTSADGKQTLFIQVINIDATKPATYKTPNVLFTYLNNADLLYANDILALGEFELVITRIDSANVSGIFHGKVKDSSGTIRVLTEGKFSAKLKRKLTPPPVPTNCKLSNVGYYFMPGATLDGAVNSVFSGTLVTNIQVYDSASSSILNNFPVNHIPGKIKFGDDQVFALNADGTGTESGTVARYDGFLIPFDNTTDSVIVKYEYDANKYMIKRSLSIPAAPTIPILESNYIWTNGNLARIINTISITNERWETEIQYDHSKTAKSFVNLQFLAYELLQFQTAINTGKRPVNLPIIATTKYYENNVLKQTDVSNFINYVMDANNYVTSFEIAGDDFDSYLYWGSEKYVLGYKCF